MTRHLRHWATFLGVATIAAMAIGMGHAPRASAATKINGTCGMHFGAVVIPFLHRYHVRIGVRDFTSGGSHRCYGVDNRNARANGTILWQPFTFPSWNDHIIVDLKDATFTAGACTGFALALGAEFPSAGLDSVVTGIGGAACADGVARLGSRLPNGADDPKGVRLVK